MRFSFVHIGGTSSIQAAILESQTIHPIQYVSGRTLKTQRDEYRDRLANQISGANDTPANGPRAARIIEFIRVGERIDTEFVVNNDAQNIKAAYAEWSQD